MFKGQKITHINKWIMPDDDEYEIITSDQAYVVSEKLAHIIAKHEGFTVRVYFA